MIGDESPQERARQEEIAKLKSDLLRLKFARDAFEAQADYADRQVELHDAHIKNLKAELRQL